MNFTDPVVQTLVSLIAFFGVDILIILAAIPLFKWWKNRSKK